MELVIQNHNKWQYFFSFNFFHCIKSLSYLPNKVFRNFAYLRMPRQKLKFLISSYYNSQLFGSFKKQIKTLKIFIFLGIFFIGLILTKYFWQTSNLFCHLHICKTIPRLSLGCFFWLHHATPKVSWYQVFSQTILPKL